MGLLEYQAMPSLCDVAHDGCVQVLYNSSWKFHQLAAGQLLSWQPVQYGKGRQYGPSITYKITPAGSLSSSQPGGPSCWASPLVFSLIDNHHRAPVLSFTGHWILDPRIPNTGLFRWARKYVQTETTESDHWRSVTLPSKCLR